MRPCTAVTISIVAALLLAGCSPKAVINQSSETLPSTTVTPAVEDTHMIVCAETEQVIREPVYEASAASTFSQETDGTEIGEDATPANPSTETQVPFADESTQPTQEAPPQPPTEPKPTSPASPTDAPETSPPTEPLTGKPTDPPPETQHLHSWDDWKQTKAPTCGASGQETRSCISCGAKETRSVEATGKHTWAEMAPSCTEAGERICTVCGAKEIVSALGHSWIHHEEEGRWETIIICYCGAQFHATEDWDAHASADPDLEYLDAHAGYYAYEEWEVSSPAYDSCSRCGEVKTP